jgi:AraC-like DNA-binding protein
MPAGDEPLLEASALPQVMAAGHAVAHGPTDFAEHRLAWFELNYLSSGRYTLALNGEPGVTEIGWVYAYRPGDVVSAHMDASDGELHCRWVKFSWPAARAQPELPARLVRGCALKPAEQQRFIAAFDRLLELHAAAPPGWQLPASALLLELVALVVQAGERQRVPAPSPDRTITAGLAFMERNLTKPILIRDVARACGLSEDYFTRLFRRQLGLPPMQHLISLRLAEARRRLIADPRAAVAEVAKRCGFDDPGHFARLFRRRFGVPPRAFRSRLD